MNRFWRAVLHLFSGWLLLLGSLHLLRVRSARGLALRSLKSLSEALAPFIALAGGVSAGLALLLKAPLAALAAASGGLLSLRYVTLVAGQPAGFAECFGADWEKRLEENLPPAHKPAMLRRRWQWRAPAAAAEIRWEPDLVYHVVQSQPEWTGLPLRCDLWRPPQSVSPSGTALIYVHGGGYFTSSKDFGTRSFFRHLAGQGHLIMDVDYRLAPRAGLFDMLSDVQHAIAWMKSNAEWLGADPRRIVLAGGSAGAHLAMLAAYAGNHPRLTPHDLRDADLSTSGVVSYYGIVDLAATYRSMETFFARSRLPGALPGNLLDRPLAGQAISLAAWVRGVEPAAMRSYLRDNQSLLLTGLNAALNHLLGGAPEEIPEVYRLASPLTYAGPSCPPSLFIQGAHDYLLPLEPARRLHHLLRQAGARSIYVEFPQTEHTFDLFLPEVSPPAQVALYHTERFLALLG
jgi:acetyl esterase/lipase